MQRSELIAKAKEVRSRAYAPYSDFQVGAAVLTASGEVFIGCNVENASYGLAICAERVALSSAVAAGFRSFQEIAIVTSGGHAPCGACRQFMAEFGTDLKVVLVNADDDQIRDTLLGTLLPDTFHGPVV